jgi:hypothetical protein
MIHASTGPLRSIDGNTSSRTRRSIRSSDHGALPTKCSSDWCCAGAAAIGSTLLPSPGISSPRQ